MPSWNIHIAHAERLLEGGGPVARAVRDRNAFLFGNLVPDIYVGYMVPAIVRPIPYRITHFAAPEHIPRPRECEFWDAYVAPLARELLSMGEASLACDPSAMGESPLASVSADTAIDAATGVSVGAAAACTEGGADPAAAAGTEATATTGAEATATTGAEATATAGTEAVAVGCVAAGTAAACAGAGATACARTDVPADGTASDGVAVRAAGHGLYAVAAAGVATCAHTIETEASGPLAALTAGRPCIEPLSIAKEAARVAPAHAASFVDEVDARATASLQEAAFGAGRQCTSKRDTLGSLLDLTLGVWVHLLADTTWNTRVREALAARGETPSRGFRIKKQADFDLFGKSLAIDMVPLATPALIETAAHFAQYPIDERSVCATTAIAHEVVRTNHVNGAPVYQLLDEEFFAATFTEVIEAADALFAQRASSRAFPSR